MGLEQKEVTQIVQKAVNGSYQIPEFQRDFVWRPERVKILVESLYKGYPIGSFLLWDNEKYTFPRGVKGTQSCSWIVDGQQRVTSLCIIMGVRPYWWPDQKTWEKAVDKNRVLVNLCPSPEEPLFALWNPIRDKDPRWVCVTEILRLKDDSAIKAFAERCTAKIQVPATSELFSQTFTLIKQVWEIRSRLIPLATVEHELEDVAEIFVRLNKQGVDVKEADQKLALISALHPAWVKKSLLPFDASLRKGGYRLEPGVFLRTAIGLALGHARLEDVKNDFWQEGFLDTWKKSKEAIRVVVKKLYSKGLLCADLLPSKNSLIPLFILQGKYGDDLDFDYAFRWFLLANEDGRYSGAAVTALSEDIRAITGASSQRQAVDDLLKKLHEVFTEGEFGPDFFMGDYRRNKFGRLLIYLLIYSERAEDWVSKTRIGYDKSDDELNKGFLPEWHHIFPRAVLKKSKWRNPAKINSLANITVLNEETNRKKLRKTPFDEYVRTYKIGPKALGAHLIPTEPRLRAVSRFNGFLEKRAALLSQKANDYYDRLKGNG